MNIPKIYASQSFLRYSFITANTVVLVLCLVFSVLGYTKIPDYTWCDFVFWLYKPFILIEVTMTVIVIPMGYTGAIKFNKCWQSSYSFFVFLMFIFSVLAYLTAKDIKNESETIIPKLYLTGQYYDSIYKLAEEYECLVPEDSPYYSTNFLVWEYDEEFDIVGMSEHIKKEMGDFPDKAIKYTLVTMIIYVIFFAYNLFISLFIAEPDSSDDE